MCLYVFDVWGQGSSKTAVTARMPSQVCNDLLEEHFANERNASSDSGRAMAAIRTLGFLRVADYFCPEDVYNSDVDAEYRQKTIKQLLSRVVWYARYELN